MSAFELFAFIHVYVVTIAITIAIIIAILIVIIIVIIIAIIIASTKWFSWFGSLPVICLVFP